MGIKHENFLHYSSDNKTVFSTSAIIGIVVGLGGLFLLAFALFLLYCWQQRRYDWQDNNPYGQKGHYYYGQDPRSTSASTAQTYATPHYTFDYKSQVQTFPTITATAATPNLSGQDDFSSNADYYDRLENRNCGRPLKELPKLLESGTPEVESVSTSALPTHPRYIPRSLMPGLLGTRPGRSSSQASTLRQCSIQGSSDHQRTSSQGRLRSLNADQEKNSNKLNSYAIQAFLTEPDEPQFTIVGAPSMASERSPSLDRNRPKEIHVELTERLGAYEQGQKMSLPAEAGVSRGSSPVPPPQSRRGTPVPPQFMSSFGSSAPNVTTVPPIPSLILPSVPRIRVPGKKPPRLIVDESPSMHSEVGQSRMGTSGPLAFPDSRFSVRPPHDRIVEQTIDRSGQVVEVPIGSGKSYLYG